jgi:5-methyltetrahydrofolate corrinoid/iron sulfur protein methyltransferase
MLIIADNLTITNPTVAKALQRFDQAPIQDMVHRCVQAGAQAVDLNSGPLTKAPAEHFRFLVESVQAVTSLPLMMDTTNPTALAAGLQVCRNPAIINGFSLEPAKLAHILPLAQEFEADIIGYLLHSNSQVPIETDEMMSVAVGLFEAFTSTGLPPQRLIIDPVVAPLGWDKGVIHNQAVLGVLRGLPELLGTPVRSIAGLSNLSSGVRPAERKIAMESAYLPMLAAAGLTMALLDALHPQTVSTARSCTALLSDGAFAWAEIGL